MRRPEPRRCITLEGTGNEAKWRNLTTKSLNPFQEIIEGIEIPPEMGEGMESQETDQRKPLGLELVPTRGCFRRECVLCGEATDKADYEINLVYRPMGINLAGPICERCVAAGLSGAMDRVKRHIRELRERAGDLEALHKGLASEGADWLSLDELQAGWRAEREQEVTDEDEPGPMQ